MSVVRYDRAELRRSELKPAFQTEEGYLYFDAYAAKVGIQEYRTKDGKVYREFRPPEEVFAQDSLASLARKPITLGHPGELVSPDNVQEYGVGTVGEETEAVPAKLLDAGGFVRVSGAVFRRDAIEAVLGGTAELSCGYECDLDPTPGEWNGQPYDAVQRNIRQNHLAIVDKGRAGPMVRMRIDSAEAEAHLERFIDSTEGNMKIDGALEMAPEQEDEIPAKSEGAEGEMPMEPEVATMQDQDMPAMSMEDVQKMCLDLKQMFDALQGKMDEHMADWGQMKADMMGMKEAMDGKKGMPAEEMKADSVDADPKAERQAWREAFEVAQKLGLDGDYVAMDSADIKRVVLKKRLELDAADWDSVRIDGAFAVLKNMKTFDVGESQWKNLFHRDGKSAAKKTVVSPEVMATKKLLGKQ